MISDAKVFKLNQWANLIRAANESGMNRREWCVANGVTETAFYYWQRQVREHALKSITENQNLCTVESVDHAQPHDFFKLTLTGSNPITDTDLPSRSNNPGSISIHSGRYVVEVGEGFSKGVLTDVLEALDHV